jgi:hypothetical protein
MLANDWKDSEIGMIAEVECTEEKNLCDNHDVRGFPTLKYGDPLDLETYEGDRKYSSMAEFAKNNLVPLCSPKRMELCDEEKKQQILAYMAMPKDELESVIHEEGKKLEEAEAKFLAEVQALQDKYEALTQEKEDTVAAVKAGGLGFMRTVVIAMVGGATRGGNEEL